MNRGFDLMDIFQRPGIKNKEEADDDVDTGQVQMFYENVAF
jgi:hypothetical protein